MNDDLERRVRERVREGFTPTPAEDHATSVRAKVTASSPSRRRFDRRRAWAMAVALAAVLVAVTIVSPRLLAYRPTPDTGPARVPAVIGQRGAAPIGGPDAETAGLLKPASALAEAGHARADLIDARRHLSFEPALPALAPERGTLQGLYTLTQRSGAPSGAGLDNVLVARYEGDLSVVEKRLDPGSVNGSAAFMTLMGRNLERGTGRAVRTAVVQGTAVALWDAATGTSPAVSHVYWFRDGVGYVITAPAPSTGRLLAIAGTMLR